MAVDLGLRGAAQRLREGTWYETAAQVERAADEIARLTAERDALLAACEEIASDASSCSCPPRRIDPAHGEHCHQRIARAAIASTRATPQGEGA